MGKNMNEWAKMRVEFEKHKELITEFEKIISIFPNKKLKKIRATVQKEVFKMENIFLASSITRSRLN